MSHPTRPCSCMARKLRVQYPGAIYHVMSRGDHLEVIFRELQDRQLFLATLSETCDKTDWQVHAFCLMSNHFHLVIETPRGNLSDGMKWLLGTYTSRFNRKHKLFGHLFSGRYQALPVEGSGTGYLKSACDYVHLNPVRASILGAEQRLETYTWSSYRLYLKAPEQRPSWLRVDRLLGEWGIPVDSAAGREQFAVCMKARRKAEQTGDFTALPRGWCHGSDQFRQELLLQMTSSAGSRYAGPEWRETMEKKAQRILAEEMNRRGWDQAQLEQRRKADPEKLEIAQKLRAETTVTWSWITQHLKMGAPAYVANAIRNHSSQE
jgi:REP-associated tyrosine transposase